MTILSANVIEVYLKTTVVMYSSNDFHKNFNKFLNTNACLNPSVSMHLSMAATHNTNLTIVH